MSSWFVAAVVSAAVSGAAVPFSRRWAFRNGFFERKPQTERRRSQRRTTIGGPLIAITTAVGAATSRTDSALLRATLGAALVVVVAGWWTARGRGVVHLERLVVTAMPVAAIAGGLRLEATGEPGVDVVITAAVVAAAAWGVSALTRTDGTATVVTAASAAVVALLALDAGQDNVAIVAAALLGSCAGLLLHALPPGDVVMGRTGGTFAGAVLAMATIEAHPPVGAPGRIATKVLLLVLPTAAAVLSEAARWRYGQARALRTIHLDERFEKRMPRTGPVLFVGGTQAGLAVDAFLVGEHHVDWRIGLGVGLVLLAAFLRLAFAKSPYEGRAIGFPVRMRIALVAIVLLVAGAAALGLAGALRARSHLEAGRDAAQAGLDAARSGDVDAARAHFATAHDQFAEARDALDSPVAAITRAVPVVAQNVEAARVITDVGLTLAGKGEALAARAGADDLRVRDGTLPVEQARSIGAELDDATRALLSSRALLTRTDSDVLAGEVRRGIATLLDKIDKAGSDIGAVQQATAAAPGLFGGDGPRRYFLAVVTPTELRGSGGLLGQYGILTADAGKLSLGPVQPVDVLNGATDQATQAACLPAVYRDRYSGFRPDVFWQNVTTPADFPTTASAIEACYPKTAGGAPLDGVISVDPIALASLLKLTGPVTVSGWPEPISAGDAAQVLLFDQYDHPPADRDAFLGRVARAVFDRLSSGSLASPSTIVSTMADAARAGHLRMHGTRPDEERLFTTMGTAGSLPALGADSFELVTQNGSESKIDWYLHRSVTYDAVVDPGDGSVKATATITLRNDAPASGVDSYIIGGDAGGPTAAGESRLFVTFYSPLALQRITVGGQPATVTTNAEQNRFAYTALVRIPPGGTSELVLSLEGTIPAGPAYIVTVGLQPTVNPDHVTVHVTDNQGRPYVETAPEGRSVWDFDMVEPLRLVAQAPGSGT